MWTTAVRSGRRFSCNRKPGYCFPHLHTPEIHHFSVYRSTESADRTTPTHSAPIWPSVNPQSCITSVVPGELRSIKPHQPSRWCASQAVVCNVLSSYYRFLQQSNVAGSLNSSPHMLCTCSCSDITGLPCLGSAQMRNWILPGPET